MDALMPAKHRPIEEITLIPYNDERYPPLLRQIADAPKQLYVRGNANVLLHAHLVAFVGTRKATSYGETASRLLAGPIARAGAVVVSGLAFGVDAACHESALEVNGLTVAVLAGGVDDATIGPRSHLGLAHRILASGGALVSEFPPGLHPAKFGFPRRNRIIAGISRAVVVVEAARRSGSLITADIALRENRDVYCVPGNITSTMSHGTNDWLSQGARPLTSPEELLQDIGLAKTIAARPADTCEAAVLDLIIESPRTADELAAQTGYTIRDILVATTSLTLKNLIAEQRGAFIKN